MSPARLLPTFWCDARLQYRQGFYLAAAFVGVVIVFALSRLPAMDGDVTWLVPPLVASNLTLGTFYFVGGLVLLEKGEGTLEALVVTPLRPTEYLVSKIVTLTALALVENLVIVAVFFGGRLGPGVVPLALGIVLASILFSLLGFIAVARYDSINEYLAPSVVYAGLASIPVFPWLLHKESWLLYLHPLQGAMVLMSAAFAPPEPWQLIAGLLSLAVWISLLAVWSGRAFGRFVVAQAGTR